MANEESLDSSIHAAYIEQLLDDFSLDKNKLAFVVGDNAGVNKATADKLNVSLVGCSSHKFNLAVNKFLKEENRSELLDQVNLIIVRLSTLKNLARLRNQSGNGAQIRNATRWSSSYTMLNRFLEIYPLLTDAFKAFDQESFAMLPSPAHIEKLKQLEVQMKGLNAFTLALQDDELTLDSSRMLLDSALKQWPSLCSHIGSKSKVIHSPHFENAVEKFLAGNE